MKVATEYRLYYSSSSTVLRLSVIGLATSTSPEGTWTDKGLAVTSVNSTVQPCKQMRWALPYLFWGNSTCYHAKENMTELNGPINTIDYRIIQKHPGSINTIAGSIFLSQMGFLKK